MSEESNKRRAETLENSNELDVEWVNGIQHFGPSPSPEHNSVLTNLTIDIGTYLRRKQCKLYTDRTDLILKKPTDALTADELKKPVVPDLFIFCHKNFVKVGNNIVGVPDFILEVLSPGSRKKDLVEKKSFYLEVGVKEYWVVDYLEKEVTKFFEGEVVIYTFDELIKVEIFEDFEIDFEWIRKELSESEGN